MKKILVLIVVLAAGGFSLYWFASHRGGHAGHRHEKNVYYCPMHPQIQRDKPGDCPICYMKLVKKDNGKPIPASREPEQSREEGAAIGTPGYVPVELNEHQRAVIGLKTAPVERRALAREIRTVGMVAHDPGLYQLQAEYLAVFKNYKNLLERDASEDVLLLNRQLTDAAYAHLLHTGFNQDLIRELGERGEPDHSLFLNHGGPVWIYAPVYEYELPYVKVGQSVIVKVPALRNKEFGGTTRALDVMVDPVTRTVRTRILVNDPDAQLKPEMIADVILTSESRKILAVPSEAVMHTGERAVVFVDTSGGNLEPRDVHTGVSSGGYTEVIHGLSEDERVVVDGNFFLDSESRLKAAITGASGEAADPHAGHK